MPRHLEKKKDAPNGETLREVVREQRSADIRMGKPGSEKPRVIDSQKAKE